MPGAVHRLDSGFCKPSPKKRSRASDAEVPASCSYALDHPSRVLFIADPSQAKRQRRVDPVDEPPPTQTVDHNHFLADWLSESAWSRSRKRKRSDESSEEPRNKQPYQQSDSMPRPDPLPSPVGTPTTSSGKTAKSSASVRDPDYRRSLGYRNIYIQKHDPPAELMRRARNIISLRRHSPAIDHGTIAGIRENIRQNQDRGEEDVKIQIAASVIPGFNKIPDERLERSPSQLWYNSVPIPLDPDACFGPPPLPLPKPKPDAAFGYSENAFSPSELRAVELLVQSPRGKSFASPDGVLQFPFLIFEIKSQAKEGSLYTGTNQAAGAGAIAMKAILELWSLSLGLDDFDFDEPRVFSVTMDQNVLSLNVHWIGRKSDTDAFTYNLEEVSMCLLKYGDGIQDLKNAIKNICDHFANESLKGIRKGLETYCTKLVALRGAGPVESLPDGVESRAPVPPPSGNRTPPLRPKKKGRRTAKAVNGKKGRAIREAEEQQQPRRHTRSSTRNGQGQVEDEGREGRIRRMALATDCE
ncbi:MAG: hypothetical protein M1817_001371 [Caeruleum heppii]|nr:MAG: hypothetical protein M1817_001371 [Caeruleum heppii]